MKKKTLTPEKIIRKERHSWCRLSSDTSASFVFQNCREEFLCGNFLLKRFTIPASDGKKRTPLRILFFSDTHIRSGVSRSFFPFLKWENISLIQENLFHSIALTEPHVLLFGGDLAGENSCFPDGAKLFHSLDVEKKFAIYGNWDKKGKSCLSYREKRRILKNAGVELLVNAGVFLREDLYLYGLDDFRQGFPVFSLPEETYSEGVRRLIAVHNPDTVTGRLCNEEILENDLFLCGHTHGGQIRVPFFGALSTSSYSGKSLEKNWYRHKKSGAKMYVSCGIGTTFIHARLFAPPEIVLLEFL